VRSSFRKSGLSRLGGIVNNTLDEMGVRQRVLEEQAVDRWREVVGPHIAASSAAQNVRDGVLFVACKSSMWANELMLHRLDIIKRLNKALGRKVVNDIRFSAKGFKRASEAVSKEETSSKAKNLEVIQISDEQAEAARKAAAACSSEELAKKIEKAILTSKRLEELKRIEGNG